MRQIPLVVLIVLVLLLSSCGAPRVDWTDENKIAFLWHSSALTDFDLVTVYAAIGTQGDMRRNFEHARDTLDAAAVPDFLAVYHEQAQHARTVCARVVDAPTRAAVDACQAAIHEARVEEARIVEQYGNPFPPTPTPETEKAGE